MFSLFLDMVEEASASDPFWFLPSWLRSFVLYSSASFFVLGSGIAALLYYNQNRLLYHPVLPNLPRDPAGNPERYREPSEWGMEYDNVQVTASDGVKLHCWFIRHEQPRDHPTLIFFQENAGNMGLRLPSMYTLFDGLKVNILMVSYRGYGRSEGEPLEAGIKLDADAVIRKVVGMAEVDPKRIMILGRSLGGAVTCYVAEKYPEHVKGIILENTFTSIPDMVDVVLPWVAPLKFLVLTISWSSVSLIPRITCPILFISGSRDELVPPEHMKRLHDAATKSMLRVWHAVPGGTHNDTCMVDPTYVATIKAFMGKIGC
mmetsp:Transcript_19374/g.46551  ORF Transcript_19374/g.46551 Transcript_19374/m.46551 type:complete len:317 (-) Transcript_19374:60-1010(-)